MFTGIVAAVGDVTAAGDGALRLRSGLLAGAPIGASVAVDGVCLTVTGLQGEHATFDVSPETLSRSTLGAKRAGDRVNLERPVRAGDELGGHVVQGHVDAVGTVVSRVDDATGCRLAVEVPEGLERFVVEKGSITFDGVSLTVASIDGRAVVVALVPHTLAVTTLGDAGPGRRVNVEVDVIAKYVQRLAAPYAAVGPEAGASGYL